MDLPRTFDPLQSAVWLVLFQRGCFAAGCHPWRRPAGRRRRHPCRPPLAGKDAGGPRPVLQSRSLDGALAPVRSLYVARDELLDGQAEDNLVVVGAAGIDHAAQLSLALEAQPFVQA